MLSSDRKLKKVKDENIILSLLSGAKEDYSEVYIWKLIGNSKHLGQVRIESIRKSRKDFCIIPAEGQDRLVQELMGSHNYVDLFIPSSALLLRCQIKQTDAPYRYYLHLPNFVAQNERRKSFRLQLDDDAMVKIHFGKSVSAPRPMSQHFLKGCHDISSGGFSFYVSKMELKFFQPTDQMPRIEIKADEWMANVGAEVISIREIEPNEGNELSYKVWRVSCRFTQIDQISRKYLERYILERIKEELHAINS